METTIRWCEDIGMFAYDRSIPQSCVHATAFCRANCFNDKLYKLYPAMRDKDIRNEQYWAEITGEKVRQDLARRKKQTNRVRLMTRGEAFSTWVDIPKVESILKENPDTLWWTPTRGWRDPLIRAELVRLRSTYSNAKILASIDPTTTAEEQASLDAEGWSTMYFGEDDELETKTGNKRFKCPKTWGHVKGACAVCKRGCFKADDGAKPVHVHLKQH